MRRSRDDSYREAVEKLHLLLDGHHEMSFEEGASLCEGHLSHDGSLSGDTNEKFVNSPKIKKRYLRKMSSSSMAGRTQGRSRRFRSSLFLNGRRHNSWHNLIKIQNDDDNLKTDSRYEEILGLVKKQENYIKQLENEGDFCREKLGKLLRYTKDLLEEKNIQDQNSVIEVIKDRNAGHISTSTIKLESIALQKKVDAIQESEKLKEQALRKEISVLSESLNHLRSEFEEVTRRESEAVEQVKRSVDIAEQVRLEKTDLEFEIGQLKLQVERQQARIRTLIEEQVIKSEEERNLAEKKYQNQLIQLKEEFQTQAGESSRVLSENDKLKNTQIELRRNLEDRDKLIQELRAENDKRIADLQLEIVSCETRRQKSDQELALLKLDFDGIKHDLKSEKSRSDSEVRSYKSRLSRTEEMLTQSREENLRNVEKNASLEREVSLLKLSQEQSAKDNSSNALLESYVKECDSERRTHRMIVEKLEDLVRRQSRIIGELKNQSSELADKLETVSKDKLSISTERDDLLSRIAFLEKNRSELDHQRQNLQSEVKSLQNEVSRQDAEIKEMNTERMNFLRDEKYLIGEGLNLRKADKRLRHSPALNSTAITIQRKNQVSSPKKCNTSMK